MDNYKTLEYLEPQADGTFKYIESGNPTNGNQLIQIPDGAEIAYFFGAEYNHISFYKKVGKTVFVISPNYKDWNETSYKSIDEVPYQYVEGFLVWQRPTKDQGLISGADVPALLKKGQFVQYRVPPNGSFNGGEWVDVNLEKDEEEFSLGDFINSRYEWRLKPATLTVNAELPKPSNTTLHNQNYSVTYEFGSREERNAFVEALGGNNS